MLHAHQHSVTTSLDYRDPDRNFVELQVDNFATPDEATEYMRGPEYASDPVGVSFIPEAWPPHWQRVRRSTWCRHVRGHWKHAPACRTRSSS